VAAVLRVMGWVMLRKGSFLKRLGAGWRAGPELT
jgi:hypothetical protein